MWEVHILFACILVWTAFIWACSLTPGSISSAHSDAVVSRLSVVWQLFHVSEAHTMIMLVRKSAHMLEYMILGSMLYACIYLKAYTSTSSFSDSLPKVFVPSMLVSVLIASIDEMIQTQVIGRCGNVFDVGIDSIGILLGILISTRATQAYVRWRRAR